MSVKELCEIIGITSYREYTREDAKKYFRYKENKEYFEDKMSEGFLDYYMSEVAPVIVVLSANAPLGGPEFTRDELERMAWALDEYPRVVT